MTPRKSMAVGMLLVAGLMLFSACAGNKGSIADKDRHYISATEIDEFGAGVDLYTLVRRVRPAWLIKSGPHSMSGGDDIRVYVNGMRFDDPSALRFYNGLNVESLRFIDAGPATARFGIGHSHGAIIVEKRGGGFDVP